MDLTEKIARLIDPEAWEPVPPGMGSTTVGIEQQYADQREARKTARRVIDGLGLTEQTRTMCDGLMPNGRDTYGDTIEHRLVTTWEPGNDAPEPTPRVRQIYEEDI